MKTIRLQFKLIALIAALALAQVGDKRGTFSCPGCCTASHSGALGARSTCNRCNMTNHLTGCPKRKSS
ncbi:MAG TPA: hypothetical protein VLG09_03005 [Candidatus Saccharimonadales bacterium]|nr:hypothetical protein [Candidatus Saccharimonadales bacterium]